MSKIESHHKRPCFLCGGTTGRQVFDEVWDVVGIGPTCVGIRVCDGCGMVLQDPVVCEQNLKRYYTNFSNYTNPGRCGEASDYTIRSISGQMAFVDSLKPPVGRAFQVGCSNGYTLSAFRNMGWEVDGVDLSSTAAGIAKKLYGLTIRVGSFEDLVLDSTFDLVVATHVLEHLRDPVGALRKMLGFLSNDSLIFVEVPCLTRPDLWPNAYFAFEHLQYFSEVSLRNCLATVGLKVVKQEILYDFDYPVIRVGACRAQGQCTTWQNDMVSALSVVEEYMKREHRDGWGRISKLLERTLLSAPRVILWGAGIHTSQLLAKTSILDWCHIERIVDSDRQKWGKRLAGIPVGSPADVEPSEDLVVVISTYASENEVYAATSGLRGQGVRVIRLYSGEH